MSTYSPTQSPTNNPTTPTSAPTANPSPAPTYVSNQVMLTPADKNPTDITVTLGTAANATNGPWSMLLPWDPTLDSAISTDNWGIEVLMEDQYQFTSGISEVSIEINGSCPDPTQCDLFWVWSLLMAIYNVFACSLHCVSKYSHNRDSDLLNRPNISYSCTI